MCAWGVTWRPPRTPSRDPELPMPLSQLGPPLEKGHHEQLAGRDKRSQEHKFGTRGQ